MAILYVFLVTAEGQAKHIQMFFSFVEIKKQNSISE